jgi:hypothetical protein
VHVNWVKRGMPSTHPVQGDVLRALRKLQRDQKPSSRQPGQRGECLKGVFTER